VIHTTKQFLEASDLLLRCRDNPVDASAQFQWPRFELFNWVKEYFDVIAAGNSKPALRVVDAVGTRIDVSFARLAQRSSQVANFLMAQGLLPGDRMLLMLANCVPTRETTLAAIRLGAPGWAKHAWSCVFAPSNAEVAARPSNSALFLS
jgi:acetyl-CoA synthetase